MSSPGAVNPAERITYAAIRLEGRVFLGLHHSLAMERAVAAGCDERAVDLEAEQGFVTTEGRFLNRREAAAFVGSRTELLMSEDLPLANLT